MPDTSHLSQRPVLSCGVCSTLICPHGLCRQCGDCAACAIHLVEPSPRERFGRIGRVIDLRSGEEKGRRHPDGQLFATEYYDPRMDREGPRAEPEEDLSQVNEPSSARWEGGGLQPFICDGCGHSFQEHDATLSCPKLPAAHHRCTPRYPAAEHGGTR
jgi:hypothetical protein